MKKIYILTLTILAASFSFGQKTVGEIEATWDRLPTDFDRSEDTLNPASFSMACISTGLALYTAGPGNGYFAGTNVYGDLGKGQKFILPGSASVVGAQVLYGVIEVNNGLTMVTASLFDNAQSLLVSATPHNVSAIDTTAAGAAGLVNYSFASTAVTNDFYIMVAWALGDDTLAIVSTTDPCGNDSYEIASDGTWSDMESTWSGTKVDLVITALVDDLAHTGLFDVNASNFGIYQADNNLVLNSISEDVILNSVSIYDVSGRLVKTFPIANQWDNYSFDISDINAGNYIVTLNSSFGPLSQKMNLK